MISPIHILGRLDAGGGSDWIVTFDDGDQYRGSDLELHSTDPDDQWGNIDVQFDACLGRSKAKRHALRHKMQAIPNIYYEGGVHDKPSGKAYSVKQIVRIIDTVRGEVVYVREDPSPL